MGHERLMLRWDFVKEHNVCQASSLLKGLPPEGGNKARGALASVVPNDEACCGALELLYAANVPLCAWIPRW